MMVHRRLLQLARPAAARIAVTSLTALATVGCLVGVGAALAVAVERLLAGSPREALIGPLVVGATLSVGRVVFQALRDLASGWTAAAIKLDVRDGLAARVLDLGPGWLGGERDGDVGATLGDGVEALHAYVGSYLPQLAVALGAPLVLVVGFVALDPVVGLVMAVAAVLVPLAKPLYRRIVGDRSREHWEAYQTLSSRMLEAFRGMSTLKMLGAADAHGRTIAADAARLYRTTRRNLGAALGLYTVTTLAIGVGTVVAVAVGALRLDAGQLSGLGALLVLFVAAECFRPLLELENYWHAGFHGIAAANGIDDIEGATPPVGDEGHRASVPSSAPSVIFEGVTFRYPGATRPALRRLDLRIDAGTTLALVGRSGAGKSTCVHLLQRWFDPDEGAIRFDGIDIREVPLAEHRRRIAVVSQDVHLFTGTIAENLRLPRPDATDADLRAAAERANAHRFIEAHPEGYGRQVGERGTKLSGGERQRLAIARALLADAPLLVLDEATASVDGESEALIAEALAELTRARTTLVIAHRLATAARADRLAVVDDGTIVEFGPPADLLVAGGAYAGLVAAQVAGR